MKWEILYTYIYIILYVLYVEKSVSWIPFDFLSLLSSKFTLSLRSYSDLALPEVYSKQLLAPLALGCGGAAALKLPGNILRGVISRYHDVLDCVKETRTSSWTMLNNAEHVKLLIVGNFLECRLTARPGFLGTEGAKKACESWLSVFRHI